MDNRDLGGRLLLTFDVFDAAGTVLFEMMYSTVGATGELLRLRQARGVPEGVVAGLARAFCGNGVSTHVLLGQCTVNLVANKRRSYRSIGYPAIHRIW